MRRVLAGPGTNNHNLKKDIGKEAPAGGGAAGYRRAAVATGPGASHGQYTATQDIGKLAPAGASDGYRSSNVAVGPASSHGQYTATQDIGKQLPAAGEAYWDGSAAQQN